MPQAVSRSNMAAKITPSHEQSKRRRSKGNKTARRNGSEKGDPLLACLNCRQKKVKCQPGEDGCSRCLRLGLHCVEPETDERKRPSSKTHIRELHDRIAFLEEELRKERGQKTALTDSARVRSNLHHIKEDGSTPDTPRKLEPGRSAPSDNLIARVLGGQWQLNKDEGGQVHYYGPTSSLHLTENVSNSIMQWGNTSLGSHQHVQDVAPDLQIYLLDLYWKFQNTVLQMIHKESFLHDMQTGQNRYFSTLLLYCVFACAARISDREDIRALALPSAEDLEDEQPYFVKKALQLLEEELKRPQITTIQSLQLLSVIDCARSNDTKGWLFTGDACRLAFDLGLHRDCSQLQAPEELTQADLEARSVTFWGCFVFDRLWAMYLGRPNCINLAEVTVRRPDQFSKQPSWDMKMAAAWSESLEIIGNICDALNNNLLTNQRAKALSERMHSWYDSLEDDLLCNGITAPSVYVLHLQYYSGLILLNRPSAGFGTSMPPSDDKKVLEIRMEARQTCVQSAMRMGDLLQDYDRQHGHAQAMSGTALHPISTAATILVAEIVDRKSSANAHLPSTQQALRCLKRCIKTLSELEKAYLVARRVRKIIQLIMRLCNLGDAQPVSRPQTAIPGQMPSSSAVAASSSSNRVAVPAGAITAASALQYQHQHPSQQQNQNMQVAQQPQPYSHHDLTQAQIHDSHPHEPMLSPTPTHHSHPAYDLNFLTMVDDAHPQPPQPQQPPELELWDTSWGAAQAFSEDTMPTTSQMDILWSFESFFGNGYGG